MGDGGDSLEAAWEAYSARDWVTARDTFTAAQEKSALSADDLAAVANCSWWLGDLDEALRVLQEAHRRYLDDRRPGPAALMAMEIGYTLSLRREEAQATGWMSRAARLLADHRDSVEQGYLDYVTGFESAFHGGDLDAALVAARRVQASGQRFGDPTLVAVGVLGQGRVLIRQGRVGEGMTLLDEAMVAAVSDDLDPGWAGNIYCHLMVVCEEIADLRRAGEWTEVTARWCEQMPGAGPFMGICRVHRAHVLQVRGAWREAEREVRLVCEELPHFDVGIVAEAHYQLGELRRQRGDLAGAEAEFRTGHRLGRDPQPGLALVRLAQGHTEAAATSIAARLATAGEDVLVRARLLPAAVEIAVAAGDVERARTAADELGRIAAIYATAGFATQAAHACGLVLLAAGDAEAALPRLREALHNWQQLGAPYEAARVRVLLAGGYDALGDRESATAERNAARDTVARLGAAWPASPLPDPAPARAGALTPREAEVLGLAASGKTNQQIAAELVLSIRTVERHLATVYEKLGVHGRSARAAAVSHALRQGIIP
ncbi:MAG TPA: LuxR C-terminal-related transcriptional regulator [Egibacteraceae bacterium]|nr:LuxR C-terminal-related transcriptional regulator [Egibacteraceae bacterium]